MAAQFAYYEDDSADYDVDARNDETAISKRLFDAARGEVSSKQQYFNRSRYSHGGGRGRINGVHRRGTKRTAM